MSIKVNFNLSDYAELGDIKKAVSSSEAELNELNLNVEANINFTNLLFSALNSANAIPDNSVIGLVTLLDELNDINSVLTSGGDIIEVFSPLDVSGTNESLNNLQEKLSSYIGGQYNQINLPIFADYYAIYVSGSARRNAQGLLSRVQGAIKQKESSSGIVDEALVNINQYSANLDRASRLQQSILQEVREVLKIPGVNLIFYSLAIDLVALEGTINGLKAKVNQTKQLLSQTKEEINTRQQEFTDLKSSLESALEQPPLSSDWITFANLPKDSRYEISFEGREFTYPYTEIEGPFEIGNLWIKNNIGTVGTTFPEFSFTVQRNVIDPLFGPQSTVGNATVATTYVTTPNTNNPRESADYFTIPGFGIRTHIFEGDTYGPIRVIGLYNSPLKIIAFVPEEGATGGFITSINGAIDNNPPIAIDDFYSNNENNKFSNNLLANDINYGTTSLILTEVNGNISYVGNKITLASGALLTVKNDGTFYYDPNGQFESLTVGDYAIDSFTYTVSNGKSGTDTASVTVTINGLNDKPTINSAINTEYAITDQSVTEDIAFSFAFAENTFIDVDKGDILTYSTTLADGRPLPVWLNFNPQTRTFSGVAAQENVGSYDIAVIATDIAGESVSDIFRLTVIRNDNLNIPEGSIVGTSNAESLFGDFKNDVIYGLGGNDQIFTSEGNNTVFGGTGDDLIYGGSRTDIINGEEGNDTIFASEGNNIIYGGIGDDLIYTGSGDDLIDGGVGNDTIWLGGGRDTVILAQGHGIDIIHNFQVEQTRIGLLGSLTYSDLTITQTQNATLISVGNELLASLSWIQTSNITSNNFVTL